MSPVSNKTDKPPQAFVDTIWGFALLTMLMCILVSTAYFSTACMFLLGYSSTDGKNNGPVPRQGNFYPYLYSPMRGEYRKRPPGWWVPILLILISAAYDWRWVGLTGVVLTIGMSINHWGHLYVRSFKEEASS